MGSGITDTCVNKPRKHYRTSKKPVTKATYYDSICVNAAGNAQHVQVVWTCSHFFGIYTSKQDCWFLIILCLNILRNQTFPKWYVLGASADTILPSAQVIIRSRDQALYRAPYSVGVCCSLCLCLSLPFLSSAGTLPPSLPLPSNEIKNGFVFY